MFELVRRVHAILTRKQWREYLLLQLLFGATAMIQVAGIASLAPFIALIANPKMIHTNPITSHVFARGGFASDTAFLMFFAVLVMVFIIASNTIAGLTTWFTVKFSMNLGLELQKALYRNYLHKDVVFFSKTNSSHMLAMITQEAPRFTYMVVQPLLNLISQTFVVGIIAIGLIYIDPTLACIAILLIGGGYLAVFRFVKAKLTEHGGRVFESNEKKFKLLAESLGGIKEVKLLATEHHYESNVATVSEVNAHSNAVIGLLGDFPRFAIETIAFCALLGLSLYLLNSASSSAHIISILSLYAMAGYKLLPAAQTIFKSASQIRANASVLEELYPAVIAGRYIKELPPSTTSEMEIGATGAIALRDVSYIYPESKKPALSNVTIKIRRNSLVAFVGASGAGKSTLADLLLGFLHPTTGDFYVGDTRIDAANSRLWQRHLGYVPQNIFLVDDTIAANIAFGIGDQSPDKAKLQRAARLANIDQVIESLPGQYDFRVGERGSLLSGGQRQRIGIARALYHDAAVLIMDEATSALDNITEQEIINTILDLKKTKTVCLIAHRLSTIRFADQIILFEQGTVAGTGTFEELCKSSPAFHLMVQTNNSEPDVLIEMQPS